MNENEMMIIGTTAVGLGVCGAICYACKVTNSAKPLWALLLLPTVRGVAKEIMFEGTEEA